MRILILTWEYPPRIVGGISRVVYHLAKELGKSGNEVTVITMRDDEVKSEENEANVSVYRVDPSIVEPLNFIDGILQMNFRIVGQAVSLVNRDGNFDVIHLHDWLVAYAGIVLKEIYPCTPFVCTLHSTEYGRNTGIHNNVQSYIRNVEGSLVKLAQKIIVNSAYMKNEIIEQFEAPDDAICVIPNGIDVNIFSGIEHDPELRRQFCPNGERLVLFVGRLVSGKGIYVLLNAIPGVLSRNPNVKFVIAGKGQELENLRKQASMLGLSDRVDFPGFISEDMLLKLYKCADVAVFPSLYEPFGIVALEGMVARVPVVVSDTGGFSQLIQHRVNGMKFEAGNASALAGCILDLLADPDLVSSITEKACETLNRYYRWEDIAKKTLEVYRSVSGCEM
jgi:glycogen(starch) synthase